MARTDENPKKGRGRPRKYFRANTNNKAEFERFDADGLIGSYLTQSFVKGVWPTVGYSAHDIYNSEPEIYGKLNYRYFPEYV